MRKKLKKIYLIIITLLILLVGILSGCSSENSSSNTNTPAETNESRYYNITPAEAKNRLENEAGIIVLDVRTKEEYAEGHIKDSLLIPVDVLEQEIEAKIPDKNTVIFVYCRSGSRSVTAANILVKLGYKNVFNLGGIKSWPYEIVK